MTTFEKGNSHKNSRACATPLASIVWGKHFLFDALSVCTCLTINHTIISSTAFTPPLAPVRTVLNMKYDSLHRKLEKGLLLEDKPKGAGKLLL